MLVLSSFFSSLISFELLNFSSSTMTLFKLFLIKLSTKILVFSSLSSFSNSVNKRSNPYPLSSKFLLEITSLILSLFSKIVFFNSSIVHNSCNKCCAFSCTSLLSYLAKLKILFI